MTVATFPDVQGLRAEAFLCKLCSVMLSTSVRLIDFGVHYIHIDRQSRGQMELRNQCSLS